MFKSPCFRYATMGHTFHNCPNTQIIRCKVEGCKKDHNPQAHKNFEEHLAKAKGKKGGKKVEVKVITTEETAQNTTNQTPPTEALAQTQAQAQPVSQSEYTAMQAYLKLLSDRQTQSEDTQLCFAKMYSLGDGIMIGHVATQETDESGTATDITINKVKSEENVKKHSLMQC